MTTAVAAHRRVTVVLLLVSGAAWVALCGGVGMAGHHHAAPTGSMGSTGSMPPAHDAGVLSFAGGWALMLVAMMLPVLGPPVRYVRACSLARRRGRGTALFLAGYGTVWLLAGAVPFALSRSAGRVDPVAVAVVVIAGAAAWQVSPAKQRCLNRLCAHPRLDAFGAAADRDAVRFGITHAGWCVCSCGPLMLVPFLMPSGHSAMTAVMAAVTAWLVAERLDRPVEPGWRVRGALPVARLARARLRGLVTHPGPAGPAVLRTAAPDPGH